MTKLDIVYCQICALIKSWFIQGIKTMEKQVDVLIIGAGILCLLVTPCDKDEEVVMRRIYKAAKFSFYTFAGAMVFLFIIPTTKQGMVLVASGAVIEAAKTETAQRIAGKSVLVVEKALDELLADKPKEKK